MKPNPLRNMYHGEKNSKLRSLSITIIVVVFVGLLIATNPTIETYEQFVHQKTNKEASKQDQVSRALGVLFGGFPSQLFANATFRHDYLLFSIYDTEIGNNHLKALGIFDRLLFLETPMFRENQNFKPDSNDSMRDDGSSPYSSSDQTEKEIRVEPNPFVIQRDFKVGPVTVSTYGNCSPVMDECENYAVLYYGDQKLGIDSVGSYYHPISEEEVSWIGNRYVTIEYDQVGNCGTCSGIAVSVLDDGKLIYLGKFDSFENGYLVRHYDGLEFNELTSHAESPRWALYYRYDKIEATLDIHHTCLMAKASYETAKNELLSTLDTTRKVDTSTRESDLWFEYNVAAPLLRSLALARYCGWQNDYLEVLQKAKSNPNLVSPETLQKLSKELSSVQHADTSQ